ncbi:MAG: hypothetical protein COV45_07510 [Deltaproteobacteria bacterium CG11_big_fil_rev_8_21_14_0_20_47_16]|nr:MAG: hypothetical protein COV45_07510 [Deltaproteobacteria bacterium CG11_big_fil_rev_8_21_14_0_20_47_16]
MTNNISELFSRIAPSYDKLNHLLSFSQDKRWRKLMIDAITPKLSLRVVDLCAGTLDCTVALLRKFPQAEIVAADFSQEMLDRGMEKVPHVFQNHVSIQCVDALQMELPPRSVDVVLCAYGMRNIPDQSAMLRKIHTWLAPGGELIILEFFRPRTRLARFFSNTYSKYILPTIGGLVSGDKQAYSYLHASIQEFYSLPAYRALLAQCGFHIVRDEDLTGGITSLIVATPIL